MREYDYKKIYTKLLTPEIVQLLAQIHEHKGEHAKVQEDELTYLIEIARIQSTEASNRIEGIYTSDDRLQKLVKDKTTPRNRSEKEIAGYRDVLATIHESYDYIPVKPGMILQLHRDLYKFSGMSIGGNYKTSDNVIEEEDAQGNKHVRFQPVPAWETSMAMEKLCEAYNELCKSGQYLVFFKKVMSKAKFWQMIGRGTRLCPGLKDGEDKDKFYIFDFCGNFEFFRMSNGKPTALQIALQGAIFSLKAQIVFKLQDLAYQTPELIAFRSSLVDDMVRKVQELNKDNFAVRQHLKFVELFSNPDHYTTLTYENTLQMRDELAPLITPDADDAKAVRFDALMYGIELAYLMGKKYAKARTDLFKKVSGIASVANIPEIMVQSELINKILHTDYLENAGINEFEYIRENLRDLIKYIPINKVSYTTNFADEILTMDWNESELENDDLKNYKMKAEFYVRQHQDNAVIAKLKTNQPLTGSDVKVLEEILWSELGTKQDYENEYGSKPLGEFVREIVGVDMNAAKEAFAEFLDEAYLDSNQIYFVNQIVEYIVHNGLMKDLSVLQDAPFTDNGSIVEVFTDLTLWIGIKRVIDRINANAIAA